MAIGGDYMSAASFLGIAGIIALYGYDGFLYSIGFLVAWLVALLLVAELLRNSGRYTMADVLAFRMRQRAGAHGRRRSPPSSCRSSTCSPRWSAPARWSRCCSGIKPGTTFLGMDADTAKIVTIILVGVLMIIYVTVGGMKGTTYVQIVKAFLLMIGALLMTVLVLAHYKFNLSALLGDAAAKSGKGEAFLEPGLRYGRRSPATPTQTFYSKLDLLSLGIALVLGTAGLPHILIRFYTVPDRQGRPQERALGDRHHRRLLPDDPGARLRRGGAGRQQGDHRAGHRRQHGGAAAGRRRSASGYLGGDRRRARCWRSSRRSRSPRSSRWSPGSPWRRRRALAHDFYANVIKQGQTHPSGRRSGSPGSRPSSSARSRSCWRSTRRTSTWRSWSRWRSRSPPRRNLPAILYTCSGSGSTPRARPGPSTAA